MDGVMVEITREALKVAAKNASSLSRRWRKQDALHRIRIQPFYGDYFAPEKMGQDLKIRRPVEYQEKL